MQIGAQFYTIRDFCKTTEQLSESLKKVADIGYKTVQISGTCPFEPAWLRDELNKNGLQCVITHTPADRLQNETEQVARDHAVFGCKYVGLGGYRFDAEQGDSVEEFLSIYKPVAKTLKENGRYFMYHNHDREFRKEGEQIILAKLAQAMPAEDMGFTLDTFWIQAGGGDPAWWVEHLAGRIPCIHLKDFAYGRKMAVIGEGNINFDRVFAKAEKSGVDYMLVEQDECYGEDPFECLRRSYEYLRSCGLE